MNDAEKISALEGLLARIQKNASARPAVVERCATTSSASAAAGSHQAGIAGSSVRKSGSTSTGANERAVTHTR